MLVPVLIRLSRKGAGKPLRCAPLVEAAEDEQALRACRPNPMLRFGEAAWGARSDFSAFIFLRPGKAQALGVTAEKERFVGGCQHAAGAGRAGRKMNGAQCIPQRYLNISPRPGNLFPVDIGP